MNPIIFGVLLSTFCLIGIYGVALKFLEEVIEIKESRLS